MVGASAAGLSTVEALRRKGFEGAVKVLGAEAHLPYDRPPLSKQILAGSWEPERARLRPSEVLSGLNAEFLLGDEATALDVDARTVTTASGARHTAGTIVLATGVVPRMLPGQPELTGVHTLRTLDDSLALRKEMLAATRLVVVGEGVLGAEIGATARQLGLDVTLTGPLRAPMAGQVGEFVGGHLAELHERNGVRLRLGTGVTALRGDDAGRVTGVELADGDVLPADLVVVAIGAAPVTDWLTSSRLTLDNGVVCDSRCRAAPGIYAVGDLARWYHEPLERTLRLENRTNATEQALAVADNILGADRAYTPVPYFWSDQFDVKIQVHGLIPPGAEPTVTDGDPAEGRFVVRYRSGGRDTGVLGWKMPKQSRLRRADITDFFS
ncbi:oxidoreductase [Amycolatopsis acidicola]|uniref:Oxidoreductase n=1 Tax=Amycolatopsis acidicola TaxID=2596893 RepID=A0A5N0UWQ5_9PSEU|nr:oxidoreductase [Amycolatopsis acidicola]